MGEEVDADWQAGLVEWGLEDGRAAHRKDHVCAKGHEWYVKPKLGPRIQQCSRCGAVDYGDNDLPLSRR